MSQAKLNIYDQLILNCLKTFSRIPLKVLYLFSFILFLIIHRCLKYRINVVQDNLKNAFPDYPAPKIQYITQKYYLNLCNMVVETIKLATISSQKLEDRITFDNSLYIDLYHQNKNIVLLLGHQFNWELASWLLNKRILHQHLVAYTPISNKGVSIFMHQMRTRNGAKFFIAQDTLKIVNQMKAELSLLALAADQNPTNIEKCYWTEFFGRKVPFHRGIELIAQKTNSAVIFMELVLVKKGYYQANSYLLSEEPSALKSGQLTELYVRTLEKSITKQPENYVWSHRRWKHTNKYSDQNS